MSRAARAGGAAGIRRFLPYPAYKDSGVEWLAKIPEHWEVRRLKTIASVRLSNVDKKSLDGEVPVRLCNYVDVYYHTHIKADFDFMTATATPAQVARFSLRRGDVLITKDSESWTDIAVSAVVTEDMPGVLCGYHLALIRPGAGCDDDFLSRAFAAVGPRDQFQVVANGITRFGLGSDAIQTGVFAMPPLEEQHAIAAFLDRETSRIDALVAEKERLIELLEEKRTTLITGAAAKGLDPNAPMRDSGVEWLAEIPEHWEVRRLKTIASVRLSNVDKKSLDGEVPVRLCNYVDVYYHTHIKADFDFMTATATPAQVARFSLRRGDVLITKDSESWTDIAVSAVVTEDMPGVLCGYHLALIRPGAGCDDDFLSRAFAAVGPRDQFQVVANGITRFGLGSDAIQTGVFAMPPLEEQRAITGFLDRKTARIDAMVTKVFDAISRLKELRTALISAAVTGKIDVREEVS